MGQFIAGARPRSSRALRIAIVVLLAGGGCTSDVTPVTAEAVSCEYVRAHLAELQTEPRASEGERRDQLALATRALGEEFLASSRRAMSSAQRACIADGTAPAEAFACSDASAGGASE